jgi:ABC-type protease/lipase transport system fused ATPase/permease subunit
MLLIRDGVQQAFGPRDEVLAALQQAAVAPRQAA